MATYEADPTSPSRASVKDQAQDLIQDVKSEVKHEVSRIQAGKEPVDSSQSDHVIRRHVAGLSIWFFLVIALFLIAAIAGIAIYTNTHH
jgi:hypothetical protein